MRQGIPLLLLVACSGPGPDDAPTLGTLALHFDVEREGDIVIEELGLRVDELVLVGDGPDGSVSVSHTGGTMVSLLPAHMEPPEVVLDLVPGAYRDVHTTVHLRPESVEPALLAAGSIEELAFELVVTMGVGLEGELGELEVSAGEQLDLTYVLRPDEWLGEFEDVEPTGGRILIDASHNIPLYFEIVEELEESTYALLGESGA